MVVVIISGHCGNRYSNFRPVIRLFPFRLHFTLKCGCTGGRMHAISEAHNTVDRISCHHLMIVEWTGMEWS